MKLSKKLLSLVLVMALAVSLAACKDKKDPVPGAKDVSTDDTQGEDILPGNDTPVVEIDVKDYGKITVELDRKTAPITVNHFLQLVSDGYYDGKNFHRIMPNFMIQGGAPKAGESEGSTITGEFSANGKENNITHVRGTISMARKGNSMNSASAQFFIVHQDSTFLDGQYAGFGHVTEGIEVVDAICENVPVTDENGTVEAANQPVINYIKIVE